MALLAAFEIRDVSGWPEIAQESRGKRAKAWVEGPDRLRWLRKECHAARAAEPAIETSMLRLAAAVGLPVPEGHCAYWTRGGEPVRGVIVQTFIESEAVEFSEGAEVLGGADPTYDSDKHEAHTPVRVREALEREQHPEELRRELLDILMFDAWVGNGDRHPGNWGILRATGQFPRIAPMYDTAACLGTELQNDHALLNPLQRGMRIDNYIERCPSGFGDGKELIGQFELLEELRHWPEWKNRFNFWIKKFEEIIPHALHYFEGIPNQWLGPERKWLAQELLQRRLQWLRQKG